MTVDKDRREQDLGTILHSDMKILGWFANYALKKRIKLLCSVAAGLFIYVVVIQCTNVTASFLTFGFGLCVLPSQRFSVFGDFCSDCCVQLCQTTL